MQASVSVARPLLAEAVDEADGLDAVAGVVEHLPGDGDGADAEGRGQRRHAAHDLALEAHGVEEALGGDDEVGPLEALVEAHLVGDQVEAAHQPGPRRRQPARRGRPRRRRPPGRARRRRARRGTPGPGAPAGGAAARPGPRWRPSAGRTRSPPRGSRPGCRRRRPDRRPSGGRAGGAPAGRPARRRWWPSRRGPTMTRSAPLSMASTISSPVPAVDAATGSLPSAPPTSSSPEARAISITAVRPSRRQAASTGAPSGPVTVVVRLGPPSASRVPSPPSAIGTSSQSHPAPCGGPADRGRHLRGRRRARGACRARRRPAGRPRTRSCSSRVAAVPMPAIVADGGSVPWRRWAPPRPTDRSSSSPTAARSPSRSRADGTAHGAAGRGRTRVRHRSARRPDRGARGSPPP